MNSSASTLALARLAMAYVAFIGATLMSFFLGNVLLQWVWRIWQLSSEDSPITLYLQYALVGVLGYSLVGAISVLLGLALFDLISKMPYSKFARVSLTAIVACASVALVYFVWTHLEDHFKIVWVILECTCAIFVVATHRGTIGREAD